MIKKGFDKVFSFFKSTYKFFIIYGIILFVLFFPFNYEVYMPGGLISLEDRIDIDGYSNKGDFNLTYVRAREGSLLNLGLAKLIPSWDIEPLSNMRIDDEQRDDINKRGRLELVQMNEFAKLLAFKEASLQYSISKSDIVVAHIFEDAETSLKVGDVLLDVDGVKLESTEQFRTIINEHKVGDTINIKVNRNNKEVMCDTKIISFEENNIVGILLYLIPYVDTTPSVNIKSKSREQGPSGGLMTALQIYNNITDEDITKGDKISGTGTIDIDGSVGEIGGVKYKLAGAVKKKADVFIAPAGDNYEEALKEKKLHNYDIEIILGDNFSNVIKRLKNR